MQHQVLADQAAGIGQPVGEARRRRIQQQARRADAVAGEDHHLGRLETVPRRRHRNRSRRRPCRARSSVISRTRQRGAQFHPGADRVRPVGDVGARLRPLRAAGRAMAEIDALRPALIFGRGDGDVGRPPVPAQLVHRLGIARAGLAQRHRRHRRVARRIGRIAGQAGHAHHAVVLGEERLQRRVVDRPVVGDAVQRLHPEIRRMHARKMRGVEDRAAADAVEVGDLHRRIVVVDRIIGVAPAPVRADVEIADSAAPPSPARCWESDWLHPIALFQAQDSHLRLGQAPGHRGAGRAGADDQDVDDIALRFIAWHVPPHLRAARAPRPAATSRPVPAPRPLGKGGRDSSPRERTTRSSR